MKQRILILIVINIGYFEDFTFKSQVPPKDDVLLQPIIFTRTA